MLSCLIDEIIVNFKLFNGHSKKKKKKKKRDVTYSIHDNKIFVIRKHAPLKVQFKNSIS